MEMMDQLIPSSAIAFNELDMVGGRVRGLTYPAERLEEWRPHLALFDQWMHQNPIIDELNRNFHQRAVRWSDHNIEQFRTTELYQQFMAPNGIHFQLGFALPAQAGFLRGFTLNRSDRDFTDDERDLTTEISLALAALINASAQRTSAFVEKLSSDRWTAMVVDHAGSVLSTITPDHLDVCDNGMLNPRIVDWIQAELDNHNILSTLDPIEATIDGGSATSIDLRLIPDGAGANILIVSNEKMPEWITSRLTARQLQVLKQLAAGGTNDRIARHLDISVETVKKHLTTIYRALDVADRTSAIAAIRADKPYPLVPS